MVRSRTTAGAAHTGKHELMLGFFEADKADIGLLVSYR